MMQTNLDNAGILYVVATPIGNLEDITLRALRILQEVDLIAAEDTRHTKHLLNHFEIHTPLISYYREKEAERSEELVQKLLSGETIALVSDAGTPGISDPGAVLVKKARTAGITIVPLPGPSALTAALSAAGITDGSFLFLGFPPSKKGQRQKLLSSFVEAPWALVFYESPHRIQALLVDVLATLGDRQAFWARELSKVYEDLQAGSISQLLELATGKKNRGEFVLIVHPASTQQQATGKNVEEILLWYKENTELSLKDVSHRIANDLGISRSNVYQMALELWAATKEES
ncbi:MAG: 16S rRNA (cytidine(1402)-2'-O)-methyltransferase [Proteobacteria bacterium]|nr:16S rRNA (cytidine(1402)-2'-O)-methyltransferase [Desulfocapsa sp.]MBU3944715.1 16S rRNA (cytidine(1402)-2'-O)-methyltransferase [Pseudomonadota bacterium]MCG2743280.1 16S rRNA (cytidine(1402)-2'-O)-methyltransferase [Desulfobacteraceae bacterium]MBU4027772.1 16S rRNA (cytidine(1402)-2'-O)-methyltransferase [Pseudomonadota bacterium]MBU4042757.1 16S rRNA (cytidine(1402)-2'-O)-methyltransferase [Pseudomonadota bacterium]